MRDNNLDVDDLLRASTDDEIPPEVEARMQRRLAEFRTRIEQLETGTIRLKPDPTSPRLLVFARSLIQPVRYRVPAAAAILAVVVLVVLFSGRSNGRVYAAAATRLGAARSLQYTIVLAPYVEVEFSYRAPAHQRVSCSWGIEIRSDGSGSQMVLMHYAKSYVKETGRRDSLASSADFVRQLQALPAKADAFLGERTVAGRRLVGYRVNHAFADAAASGVESLDLWLDAGSGNPDHVDITTASPGKPRYQVHVKDIRLDSEIDAGLFDMNPPAGYTPLAAPADARRQPDRQGTGIAGFRPTIKQVGPATAVVVPMNGSFLQARAAVEAVASHLQRVGVAPSGPPFGRFESEQHWDAGYPVPAGTPVDAPFQLVTLPAARVASVVVKGPWGEDSAGRWTAMLKWIVDQGYAPAGPPIEIWAGADGQPDTQTTEMRIGVQAPGK